MAAVAITTADLAPFAEIDEAKAQAMIDDALAMAATVAPCIVTEEFESPAAAKAILRGAILRWNEAGNGAVTTVQSGPFAQTQSTARRGMFWPSEISGLQRLCLGSQSTAFEIDTVSTVETHAEVCSLNLGALYCSCGASIAGFPLWEV